MARVGGRLLLVLDTVEQAQRRGPLRHVRAGRAHPDGWSCHGPRCSSSSPAGPGCRSCAELVDEVELVGLADADAISLMVAMAEGAVDHPRAAALGRTGSVPHLSRSASSRPSLAKTQGGDDPLFGLRAANEQLDAELYLRILGHIKDPHRPGPRPSRARPAPGHPGDHPDGAGRGLRDPDGRPRRAGAVHPARGGADAGGPPRARRPRPPSGRARRHAPADPARSQGGRDRRAARGHRVLQRPARPRRAHRGAVPPAVARPDARGDRATCGTLGPPSSWPRPWTSFPSAHGCSSCRGCARAFLDEDDRRLLDEAAWIEKVEPTATQLLARGGAAAALALLRERRRPDGGPILPLAEIEALEALGQLDEAIALAGREAEAAAAGLNATGLVDLTLQQCRLAELAGRPADSLTFLDRALDGHPRAECRPAPSPGGLARCRPS